MKRYLLFLALTSIGVFVAVRVNSGMSSAGSTSTSIAAVQVKVP